MKGAKCAIVAMLLLMFGSSYSQAQESLLPQPGWYMPPPHRNLAEFLATGSDLAGNATVLSAVEGERGYVRIPELLKLRVTEVRLVVDEVLFGVAPSDTIDMTLSDWGYQLNQGDRLLFWGVYTPEDNWRLRGRGRKIEGDELHARAQEPAFECAGRHVDIDTLSALRRDLTTVRYNASAFNGNRYVALCRLRGSSRWTPAGAVYELDSLAWVMGRGDVVPRRLEFPALPGCSPGIVPGDSLIVPIPPGFRGETLRLSQCPTALRVKEGFVPGLGVRLDQLNRAIGTVGQILQLRTTQLKEN